MDRSILLTEVITLTPGVALYNRIATNKKNPPIKLITDGFNCLILIYKSSSNIQS